MDADKLNEAAEREIDNALFDDEVEYICTKNAFKKGAKWLMTQPLSDRLTEEEREDKRNLLASNERLGRHR